MLCGIIVGDNFYENPRTAIGRANGAHRIATLLRQRDIKTEVLDFFNSWTDQELESFLRLYPKCDFIGLSIGLGVLNQQKVNAFISMAKKFNPKLKVIAGGSLVLEKTYVGVDIFFKGFAEESIDDIIKFLKTGRFNPFNINTIKTHDIKQVVDCLKHYPNKDLSLLKIVYTESDFIRSGEVLALEIGRGCIFKCTFCNFPLIGKKKNDYIREKEDIKQELISNYKKFGIQKYFITDDTFNDNEIKVDMLYEITQELDFDLMFVCYARVDLIHARKGSLDKLYAAGVRGMFFGLESLKEPTSRKIGKGLTGDRLKNFLSEIKIKYPRLHISISLILGLPDESLDEFKTELHKLLDEKLANSVSLFSLMIPMDHEVTNTSIFTREYEKYGYSVMSTEEIHNLNYKFPFDNDYLVHNIPWKNNSSNFVKSAYDNHMIKESIKSKISVSSWFGLAHSYNKVDINESLDLMHTKILSMDWNSLKQETQEFVENYKRKKMEYFKNNS